MTKDDASAQLTYALMDSATQLLVADRHIAPKGQMRHRLTKEEAAAYVHDASQLFVAASAFVKLAETGY